MYQDEQKGHDNSVKKRRQMNKMSILQVLE